MSGGAFRDGSAAIERVAFLEQENEALRKELEEVEELRLANDLARTELTTLRQEVMELRALARSENEGAYMRRISEDRDELEQEARKLRVQLAMQRVEVNRLKRRLRIGANEGSLIQTVLAYLTTPKT